MNNPSLFKLFYRFIRGTAFKKGEWDIESTVFDPFRFILIGALAVYLVFSANYIYRTVRLHTRIEQTCPALIDNVVLIHDHSVPVKEVIVHEVNQDGVLTQCKITIKTLE